MRLPSLHRLASDGMASLRRFPIVLACACAAAAAAIVWLGDTGEREPAGRLAVALGLGIPLFLSLRLTDERRPDSKIWDPARLLAALALAGFYVAWDGWSEQVRFLRTLQLAAALHLLVAVLPFRRPGELNGFWQYNRALLLRFVLAALYSGVLYVGLAVALAAIDNLFGVDVEGETYGRLFFAIAFVFNTWFFLGGVPRDLSALDRETEYPRGLKVFSQFVLLPIVSVYLAILTAYLVKVLMSAAWPSGWIGWLVSSVALAGILSILLVHPVRDRAENRWIGRYSRGFWIFLVPAIVMLFMAIGQRVGQYGVTEPRYFLIVLAGWLAVMAVVFGVRRSSNIKIIPATLCVVALASFAGPWGAYSVSRRSQVGRLESIMTRAGILQEGRAAPPAAEVSLEDRREISAILDYLGAHHGYGDLDPWFGDGLAAIDAAGSTEPSKTRRQVAERTRAIMGHLELEYVEGWERADPDRLSFVAAPAEEAMSLEGFDFVFGTRNWRADTVDVDGRTVRFEFAEDEDAVQVWEGDVLLVTVPLLPAVERARAHAGGTARPGAVPAELIRLDAETGRVRIAVAPTVLDVRFQDGEPTIDSFRAAFYFTLKNSVVVP